MIQVESDCLIWLGLQAWSIYSNRIYSIIMLDPARHFQLEEEFAMKLKQRHSKTVYLTRVCGVPRLFRLKTFKLKLRFEVRNYKRCTFQWPEFAGKRLTNEPRLKAQNHFTETLQSGKSADLAKFSEIWKERSLKQMSELIATIRCQASSSLFKIEKLADLSGQTA